MSDSVQRLTELQLPTLRIISVQAEATVGAAQAA
jgi:hypothetical protein